MAIPSDGSYGEWEFVCLFVGGGLVGLWDMHTTRLGKAPSLVPGALQVAGASLATSGRYIDVDIDNDQDSRGLTWHHLVLQAPRPTSRSKRGHAVLYFRSPK